MIITSEFIDVSDTINRILDEFNQATNKYGPLSSIHAGLGLITEEYHELIQAIQKNDKANMKQEAAQIAAMCLRLIIDF